MAQKFTGSNDFGRMKKYVFVSEQCNKKEVFRFSYMYAMLQRCWANNTLVSTAIRLQESFVFSHNFSVLCLAVDIIESLN